ncbi:hypothetical protein [Streptosporangium sp. NPDC002721]|uniref:hypothetical protein n=1 Tax=Streptosporangium sp. NPDC002721 TaxID=3366188 RepID=UPI0036C3275C
MDIEVVQAVVLGISCLIAALGVYALATKRMPHLPFLRFGRRDPQYYGWAVLSIAAFGVTGTLGQDVMEPGSVLDVAMLVLAIAFLIAGLGLAVLSAKRAP